MVDEAPVPGALWDRLRSLVASQGMRHGLILFITTSLANVLDYAYSVALGRLMDADGYGVLVALSALLQIVAVSLVVIRTTVAQTTVRYEASAQLSSLGAFVRRALRSTALWGLAATLVVGALSVPLSRALQIPTPIPVLVVAIALLPLLIKPVVEGTLQGLQRFLGLGAVQVTQAALRLFLGVLFVYLGLDAAGALAALPAATTGTIALGAALLWGIVWRDRTAGDAESPPGSPWQFAAPATVGIVSLAALVNVDALLVKAFFAPSTAGHYSMAVTLNKIVWFAPAAFAQVLLPKSARRYVQQRGSSRLLRLTLLATLVPCAVLTAAYLVVPDMLLAVVFGIENPFSGPVLGLLALAMSGFALVNVWLNYYLSVERGGFVYALAVAVGVQLVLLVLFHANLVQVATVLVVTSACLLVAAEVWYRVPRGRQDDRVYADP